MAQAYDVCIVGGGVVGLWVARCLADAGATCVLLERETCGAGASGGVLGALMAHAPDNWNIKKQFQFDALAELPKLIEELEGETNLSTGYAQCGRIMPVRTERFLRQAQVRSEASRTHWRTDAASFAYDVVEKPAGVIDPALAPLGIIREELAARIDPVKYVQTLRHAVSCKATVLEGSVYHSFDPASGRVQLSANTDGPIANHIVFAAGYETFTLLKPFLNRSIGGGVKGQAALFDCPELEGQPILYDDGIYIVPHDNGLCAVGSTTEKTWANPDTPDIDRNDFIDRAKALCPPLRKSRLLKRWAGVRPRCNRTDPIVGALDREGRILVATGGYKITFGIAHRMAKSIVDEITQAPSRLELPPTFRPQHHLQDRGQPAD